MPKHHQTLDVPYTPDQLFELVSDISRYPEFIKWIKALRVSSPKQYGPLHSCVGEAVVGFKGFTESFSTSVEAQSEQRTVSVNLVRGPFRKLANNWQFSDNGQGGAIIDFRIDYEFSNFVLRALASANRDVAIELIMAAFLDEAKRRYA
ncbi:MAG: type II toxin-antitoxin system RatA family toxin [Hyphomonadaceae bacterium]